MSSKESISLWFKEILACPICKSSVEFKGNKVICVDNNCKSQFPIVDGIPIMLPQLNQHNEYEKQYFDQEFKYYEKYALENWRISYIKRIFCSLSIGTSANDCYLDIGVGGSGYTVIEAARRGNKSVGIDVSIEGVKKAQYFAQSELGEKNSLCGFAVALAENLPFKNECFSKLSSIAVLEHVPNDKQAIAEIARVVKPAGAVFLLVPNAYQRIPPVFWVPYYFWDKKVGHLRHYRSEKLLAEFSSYGFVVKEVLYSAHLIKLFQNLFSRAIPSLAKKDSKFWWKIEQLDLKDTSPTGANLTLLMLKVK